MIKKTGQMNTLTILSHRVISFILHKIKKNMYMSNYLSTKHYGTWELYS